MLIATLTILLVAAIMGSGGAAGISVVPDQRVHEWLDDGVEDAERRARAKGVAEDGLALREDMNAQFEPVSAQLAEAHLDRELGAAELEVIFTNIDFDARINQMLDLRFRLKNELTREEWEALYGDLTVRE